MAINPKLLEPVLLSIVLCNYNHSAYLSESLGAILRQIDDRMEFIVVDDASTDGSPEIIRCLLGCNPRCHFIQRPRNGGVNAAFLTGVEHARGRYFYLAGADDRIEPGFLEKSLVLLQAHPEAGLSCAQSRVLLPDGKERIDRMELPDGFIGSARFVNGARKAGALIIPSNTVIFRRDAFLECGGLDPILEWHADWFCNTLITLQYGLCYLPEPLAVFRERSQGYSSLGPRSICRRRRVIDRILQRLKEPAFTRLRLFFREPGLLALAEDGRLFWLQRLLRHPFSWDLLSGRLIVAAAQEAKILFWRRLRRYFLRKVRPALWALVNKTVSHLPGRFGDGTRRAALHLFGATKIPPELLCRQASVAEPWKLR